MLKIIVPAWEEDWDPVENRFLPGNPKETILTLEHSLISISKWESKYHKPYASTEAKTEEELLDYIRFMTVTNSNHEVNDSVYRHLSRENLKDIHDYIANPMTATTINRRDQRRGRREIITSELVYYWMTALNIPFECQRWHFNRLMTLIQVASIKSQPPKKMGKKDIAAQNRSLNAARRARHGSRG